MVLLVLLLLLRSLVLLVIPLPRVLELPSLKLAVVILNCHGSVGSWT